MFPVCVLRSVQIGRHIVRNDVRRHFLFLYASFCSSATRVIIPLFPYTNVSFVRSDSVLLDFRVLANVFRACGQCACNRFCLFVFFYVRDRPYASIITDRVPIVLHMRLMFTVIFIPFNFRPHRLTLRFPVPHLLEDLISARSGVGERRDLEVVTRYSRRLRALGFAIVCPTRVDSQFVNRSFSRIRRSVTLPL